MSLAVKLGPSTRIDLNLIHVRGSVSERKSLPGKVGRRLSI